MTADEARPTVLVTQHGRLPSLCVAPCTLQLEIGPSIVEVARETERFTTTLSVPPDAAVLRVQLANHFNVIGIYALNQSASARFERARPVASLDRGLAIRF